MGLRSPEPARFAPFSRNLPRPNGEFVASHSKHAYFGPSRVGMPLQPALDDELVGIELTFSLRVSTRATRVAFRTSPLGHRLFIEVLTPSDLGTNLSPAPDTRAGFDSKVRRRSLLLLRGLSVFYHLAQDRADGQWLTSSRSRWLIVQGWFQRGTGGRVYTKHRKGLYPTVRLPRLVPEINIQITIVLLSPT